MKTQYYTATSLDGFIATEEDSLDWLFPLGNVDETGYPDFISKVGPLAMGSSTYQWMLRHAQTVALRDRCGLALHAANLGILEPDAAGDSRSEPALRAGRRPAGSRGDASGCGQPERLDRRRPIVIA